VPLDRKLRRLLERNTDLTIPLGFGEPLDALTPGTILDVTHPDRPVVGHVARPPWSLRMPPVVPTAPLDLDLSLARTLNVLGPLGSQCASAAPGVDVAVAARVHADRDVVALVEPHPGSEIQDLVPLAQGLAGHPAWRHAEYAVVARVFAAARAEVSIALAGGGEVGLRGKVDAVVSGLAGRLGAAVTWTYRNLHTQRLDRPSVFGVHAFQVTLTGGIRAL
jgi:hypothetical protein